jgi:hypothetical protein
VFGLKFSLNAHTKSEGSIAYMIVRYEPQRRPSSYEAAIEYNWWSKAGQAQSGIAQPGFVSPGPNQSSRPGTRSILSSKMWCIATRSIWNDDRA